MIKSGFFNSVNGDRKYSSVDFAEYFATFISNGIFPTPSTNLQVMAGTNMTTIVKAGKGWINGYFVVNDSDYVLQHDIADGVLKRIDRVVMRLNYLTRQIEIAVKKGTFASNPVAPTLQRDTDYFELTLADVLINNGATAITQANITDTRLSNDLCGIVHGTVDQVDTTTLFNQYQSWFNDYTEQAQTNFENWLNELEELLDENTAATLMNKVLALETNKADKTAVENLSSQLDEYPKFEIGEVILYQDTTGIVFSDAPGELKVRFAKKVGRAGNLRLSFSLYGNSNMTVFARVYVNGIPYSELVRTSATTSFTFDITDLEIGDSIEVWGQRTTVSSSVPHLRDIVIKVDEADVVY